MGITTEPEDEEDKDKKPTEVVPSKEVKDTKNWAVSQIVNGFYKNHEVDKLSPEQKQELDQRVGVKLKEMFDPNNNKTISQIMEDVPLEKLPQYLEDAYTLAFKNETVEAAKEQGKREASYEGLGVIGGLPSTTGSSEEITLTPAQKETARKMGVSEDIYLKNAKEIAARNNQLY